MHKLSWRPKLRHVTYQKRPEYVPEPIYKEAQAAKRFYNAEWEFWVFMVSREFNCSIPIAEDACIRGLKKVLLQALFVYGEKVGKWYEHFLDMGDIFSKVHKWPEFLPKLDGIRRGD